MVAAFDLNVLPLYRIKGQEWPQLPGLLAAAPPKRPARGREGDSLVVYLTLTGNTPFSSADYTQITTQMAQRFYQTPGSLTAALRVTAEVLNQFLVERNMRSTGKGQYIIGRLILGVLRGRQFFFAQSGPTHVFHLAVGEVRQIHDARISGRGLGLGPATSLYLSQVDLHRADRLLLCALIPPNWETMLTMERGADSLEILRRNLLDAVADDMSAVLLQLKEGTGNVKVLRPDLASLDTTASVPQDPSTVPVQASSEPGGDILPAPSAALDPERKPPVIPEEPPPSSQLEPLQPVRFIDLLDPVQSESSSTQAVLRSENTAVEPSQAGQPDRGVSPHESLKSPGFFRPTSLQRQGVFRWLARALQNVRVFSRHTSQWFKTMLPRLLPGLEEKGSSVSPSGMAFITIAIPLVVVAVASMVYLRYGQRALYAENYKMAVSTAVGAIGQSDAATIRHAWESTIYYLDRAESYQVTQESQALRNQAQMALDALDGILRLDFRPAIYGGLDKLVSVSRMAAANMDLYLLDSAHGNVIRTFQTKQGYETDNNFQCGPGTYNNIQVGELIDLTSLPGDNTRNAEVLAMDSNGTLLYCTNDGEPPQAAELARPELGWRGISGFNLSSDGKTMYVLDPAGNAVWIYSRNTKELNDFPDPPTFFFGGQVPQNMGTAIDLGANDDDLFLLFKDGHITACALNVLDAVQKPCTDPTPFNDNRPGHQAGSAITDAVFSQMVFADTPDRSMYLLEPLTQAVYRISPGSDTLVLQGQLRATVDQSKTFTASATAMAISPNHYLFLSIGNQVYYAMGMP